MDDSTSNPQEQLARAFELVVSYSQTSDPEPEETFLARHQDLRALLVPMLQKVRSFETATLTGAAAVVDFGQTVERIGPYDIVKELGRGGQAIVYLAEDRRLHRRVALKVLTGMAIHSPAMRIRLQREAEAASKLDHPGICNVHEIGEESSIPYIAMRYVEGKTLAEMMEEARATRALGSDTQVGSAGRQGMSGSGRPTPDSKSEGSSTREVLQDAVCLIERLARALHVAHETGLVHRDIKPRNIMVTPAGDPVLLDFGLAHDQTAHAPTVTQTGQLVGTPAYLAPEQLAVEPVPVDRRADVYALGVTLYESLTLRRPFEAPTREQLYQKILVAEPPDPRRFNPAISKDMKAILETALEKDRDRRYQTALDLAEDLRRFRELEPIRARSAGPMLRLRRWAQRNRALATALTGIFLVLACGLVVSLGLLAESSRERARAEMSFRMAMDAVEQMLTEVGLSEESLAGLPDLDATRRNLLERALAFYRRILQHDDADPRVQRQTALAHYRVAHFHFLLGQFDEAGRQSARATDWCRKLLSDSPGDLEIRRDLVRFTKEQAAILSASGEFDEAIQAIEKSIFTARELRARAPERMEFIGLLAECQADLGELFSRIGDTESAEAALREGIEQLDRVVVARPEESCWRFILAVACRRYAQVIRFTDPARQAGPLVRSLSLLDVLIERHPNATRYALERAMTVLRLGILEMSRDFRKANELLVDATRSLEQLRAQHPEQLAIRLQLADGQLFRAQVLFDEGRQAESESLLKQAEELTQGLAPELARSPVRVRMLIDTYRLLAQCMHARHRAIDARRYDEKALTLAKAHTTGPDDLSGLWTLAGIYSASGFRLAEDGERAEGEKRILKAIAIQEKLTVARPGWIGLQDSYAMALNKLASLYHLSGRSEEAEPLFSRSLVIRRDLARRRPGSAYVQSRLGATLQNVAAQHVRRRELKEARDLLEEAVAAQLVAVRIAPQLLVARHFLREHIRCYGGVLLDVGDYEGAAESAETLARNLPEAPDARYVAALLLAGSAALTDEGTRRSERYAERAVTHLKAAVAHGFKDVESVRGQRWFERLDGREDYQSVLRSLAQK